MPERARCAEVSVRRGEALHATASRVQRWLVIEQPGPWGRNALIESRLDPEVARSLQSHGKRHGVRILLARRLGWRGGAPSRRVHLAHTGPHGNWIEQLDIAEDRLAGLAHLDLTVLRSPEPPGIGDPGPDALSLVCTNGRHDACCADLGRPVVRALDAAGVPDVWESSHVGGDRFAANVVALPSGVYLGRVPPDRAAEMVRALADGVVDLDHYRGRSCYPSLVQAAEVGARRELGEPRLDAMVLDEVVEMGDDGLRATFRHHGGMVEAIVRRRRGDPQHLTCTGRTNRPWVYDLVDVQHH